jgi:inorganic pyrophosphatase
MIALEHLDNLLDPVARTCMAIVETPAGSHAKFAYDPKSTLFKLGKLLPVGLAFPFDFGFIPSTLGGDGDPIDILVLPEVDLPVGCLAEVKLLGIMEAEQRRPNKKPKRNDRVIARIVASRIFPGLDHVGQLGSTVVDELGVFFHTYKASRGQSYDVLNVGGPDRAVQLIQEGMQAFQDREAAR